MTAIDFGACGIILFFLIMIGFYGWQSFLLIKHWHGWRMISDLIANHGYTMELLDEIVATNNKKRYEYNDDKTCIRARQGHSVNVDVELKEKTPPDVLYHGTTETSVPSIMKEGIVKGTRLYVHLSSTVETAINVGKRHGKPVVLRINAKQMAEDGIKFFLSNNGVWLTEYVGVKYIDNENGTAIHDMPLEGI